MKLYIIDKKTKNKTHLRLVAQSRQELLRSLGSKAFTIDGHVYSLYDVKAEPSSDSAAVGGLLGGVVGAIGGAPGVIFGGLLGAAIGQSQAQKDQRDVEQFNGSLV